MKKRGVLGMILAFLVLVTASCSGAGNPVPDSALEAEVQQAHPNLDRHDSGPEGAQEAEVPQAAPNLDRHDSVPESTQETEVQVSEQPMETEQAAEDTGRADLPEYGNYYYDVENVVLYLELYGELPPNYITKSEARALGWEGGSVEDYREGAAVGGDVFGNREGLLPEDSGRVYTECDIDTDGYGSRGSRRLVFSNDGLYFYTSDHYESFSEVTVTEEYEVIW